MILGVFLLLAVALVSLVLGVQQRQDPLVFLSIGSSGVAGLILALAFLRSRPRDEVMPEEVSEPVVPVPPAEEAPPPVPVARPNPPALPISDYDELDVPELLPLLSELDADELRQVEAYEAQTRAHPWILARIRTLLEFETEEELTAPPAWSAQDFALERGAPEAGAPERYEADDAGPEEVAAGVVPTPEPVGIDPTTIDLGERQEVAAGSDDLPPPAAEEWPDFPIADYEWLPSSEILPLLAYLEPDELEAVRSRETVEEARPEILERLGELLGEAAPADSAQLGEAPEPVEALARPEPVEATEEPAPVTPPAAPEREPVGSPAPPVREPEPWAPPWDDEPRAVPEPVASVPSRGPAPAPGASAPAASAPAGLPIDGYDDLSIGEIIRALADLEADELQAVRAYEQSHRARTTVLVRIDTALARR